MLISHVLLILLLVFSADLLSSVFSTPLTYPLPDTPGSLHQLPLKCEVGQEFKYDGTETDGDGIKVKYDCGGTSMSKQLTCESGFKAYSKRDVINCDPSDAVFRDTETDPNNIDKAVVVWYCMKKTGAPCIPAK